MSGACALGELDPALTAAEVLGRVQAYHDARANPCAAPMELFGKCLEQNSDNVAQCQAVAALLTSCKRDQMQ